MIKGEFTIHRKFGRLPGKFEMMQYWNWFELLKSEYMQFPLDDVLWHSQYEAHIIRLLIAHFPNAQLVCKKGKTYCYSAILTFFFPYLT